ncbi:ion transporter [Magnetospira thiophila]
MIRLSRRRTHEILELARPGDRKSRLFDILMFTLVSLNVLAVILESVETLAQMFGLLFYVFDALSVFIFTIEYVLRIWSSTEDPEYGRSGPIWGRIRQILSPMCLIDLMAFLPFYLHFFIPIDLRFMRALRLFRIFKLTRYNPVMSMMLNVLRQEAPSVMAGTYILVIMIIVASSFIHLFEQEAQPDKFGSIPQAMYWSAITLTTVGFGDVTPITPLGKLFSVLVAILGVGMVALPTGLLASAFASEMRGRRARYRDMVDTALQDGMIDDNESALLQSMREELGLSEREAREIAKQAYKIIQMPKACPNCGHALPTGQPHTHSDHH